MPDKEGAEEKTIKSVVNKKQKQMMGEEGYDVARDMGRVRPSKDKKDATSYPPSDEVKKTQKVNKGPSALERVKADIEKRYGKGAIMDVKKEELDLTKVAEAFGGFIIEKKDKKIFAKPGEVEAQQNLIRTQFDKPKLSPSGQKRLEKISNPTKITDKNFETLKKRVSGEISADAQDLNTVADRTKSGSQPRVETGTYNYSKNKPKITGDVPSGQGNILTGKEDPLKTKRKSGGGRPRGSRTKIKTTPGQQSIDLGDYGRKARRRTPSTTVADIKKGIDIKEPVYKSPKTGKKLPVKLGKNLKNIGATSTKSVKTALKVGAKTTAKTAVKKAAVKGTGKLLAKRIPGIGAAISGAETFGRAASGDYVGAAISGAETIANLIPGVQQTLGTGLAAVGMARDARKASKLTNVAKRGIQTAKAARGKKGFSAFMKPAKEIKKKYAKMPSGATELGKKIRGKTKLGRRVRAAAFGQEFLPGGGVGGRIIKGFTGAAKKSVDGGHVGRRTAG